MLLVRDELEEYVHRVLGSAEVSADRSWEHGEACVLEVRDAGGTSWYAKRHRQEKAYHRELSAYHSWVPVLGGRAPWLRASDDALRALVMSVVPGSVAADTLASGEEVGVHEQAGALLRRFHDAESPEPWPGYPQRVAELLEQWIARGGDLIDEAQRTFAREEVRRLVELPEPMRVPCHRDYTPRNWLVDGEGTVRVIDFGHARKDVWVNDLNRMYFAEWRGRPDLRDAFLSGYGRSLAEEDHAVLRGAAVLGAVSSIVWAREHHDPHFEAHHRDVLARLRQEATG